MYSGGDKQRARDSSSASNTFTIEFLVQGGRDTTRPLHETQRYIEELFTVQLQTAWSSQGQGEWITVTGYQENVAKAKKYILAVCTPEVRVDLLACKPHADRLTQATQLSRDLLKENSDLRRKLESEFQIVLSSRPDGEGGVYVQGAEKDVYATVSELNSLLERLENGQSFPLPGLHHLNLYESPPCHMTLRTDHSNPPFRPVAETRSNVDESLTNLPEHVKLALWKEISNQKQDVCSSGNSYLARGVNTCREQRIKSFVDLGFAREKVECVIHTLPEAHDDDVLARLISSHQGREVIDEVKMEHAGPGRCRIQNGKPLLSRTTVSHKPSPKPIDPDKLRHIVIDGSNVAMRHGNGKVFSCKGIKLAVDHFKECGHKQITVFVPEWRKEASTPDTPITNQELLYSLEESGHLKYTPSRRIQGKKVVCYDDRFIVKLAIKEGGVIVSNDQYRDLAKENEEWRKVIETRLLQFIFVENYFMIPDDPLGRNGPCVEQLLCKDPKEVRADTRKQSNDVTGSLVICPYIANCTFGRKCKYYHPDREPASELSSTSGSTSSHTPAMSPSPTPSSSPDKWHAVHPGGSSHDELRSGYGQLPADALPHPNHDIKIQDLQEHLASLSVQTGDPRINTSYTDPAEGNDPRLYTIYTEPSEANSAPQTHQFINLQCPPDQYRRLMHSSPSLSTFPDTPVPLPADSGISPAGERPHLHTFPLMNLAQDTSNLGVRPKGITQDFSRQLSLQQRTLPPSSPSARQFVPAESDPGQQLYVQRDRHLSGFPGPGHAQYVRDTPPGLVYSQRDGTYSDNLRRGQPHTPQPHLAFDGSMHGTGRQEVLYQQGGEAPTRHEYIGRGRSNSQTNTEPYTQHRPVSYPEPGHYSTGPSYKPEHRDLQPHPGHSQSYPHPVHSSPSHPVHSSPHPHPVHSSQSYQHNVYSYNPRPVHVPNSYPKVNHYSQVRPHGHFSSVNEGTLNSVHGGQRNSTNGVRYSSLYEQAVAVLPNCEDRIRNVMAAQPHVTNLDELIEHMQNMD